VFPVQSINPYQGCSLIEEKLRLSHLTGENCWIHDSFEGNSVQ
jgi:hypothetical protein